MSFEPLKPTSLYPRSSTSTSITFGSESFFVSHPNNITRKKNNFFIKLVMLD